MIDALLPFAPLAAAGLSALTALAAMLVALGAGRAARRAQAATDLALRDAMADLTAQLQLGLAAARGENPSEALNALREEMAGLATHLASVTVGQLELNKVVGRAVKSATGEIEQRLLDTLGDAAVVQAERLEALEEAVGAAATRVEETMANVLVYLGEGLAGDGGGASAAALAVDSLRDGIAALDARLGALRDSLGGAETRLTAALREAAPSRAPSIFDSGRIVSVVAPVAMAVAPADATAPDTLTAPEPEPDAPPAGIVAAE